LAAKQERTFLAVINVCARQGQVEKALEMKALMERAGVPPSLIAYNNIMSACRAAGRLDTAMEARRWRGQGARGTIGAQGVWVPTSQTLMTGGLGPCLGGHRVGVVQ
jgi:pentatricopeptide repeat protein